MRTQPSDYRSPGGPSRRAVLAALGAAAGTLGLQAPAIAAGLRPLHLATNFSESASNAFYAQDGGFFKDQGLDVTIDTFASSGAYANGVVSGTFDIGAIAAGSLTAAHSKGIPFVLLANGGVYNAASPTTLLVVAKDSPINTAAAFKGKTIAVSTIGDIVQVAVMVWLDKNGGDYKSVSWVEMPPGVVGDALAKGRIDGGFLGEPFVTEAADNVRVVAACSTSVASRFLVTGWCTNRAWLAANPALAKSFQAAMDEAAVWTMKNRPKAQEILLKYMKVQPETAAKMHHVNWEAGRSADLLQPIIDAMVKYGVLAKPFPATELFG